MIKRINDILAGIPATVVAGIFLVLKLILQYAVKVDVPIFLDPAWIAVGDILRVNPGEVDTVDWWIQNDMKEPPEKVGELFAAVIEPAFC